MAFRVEISPEALENLDAIAAYIQQHGSFECAERWFNGILTSIRSLGEMPSSCPLAGESDDLQTEVRLLLHGKRNRRYKVYFTIHQPSATYWARKPAESDELEDLMDVGKEAAE